MSTVVTLLVCVLVYVFGGGSFSWRAAGSWPVAGAAVALECRRESSAFEGTSNSVLRVLEGERWRAG